jgi:hypothetical protein
MTSEKQIESNRRNAQLSTGPKTPEGKFKVSNNALSLGLYAKRMILPGEDEKEYVAALEAYYNFWEPQNFAEENLVREICGVWWKIDRLNIAENAHLRDRVHIEAARKVSEVEPYESRHKGDEDAYSRAIDRQLLEYGLKMAPNETDLREALKHNLTEARLNQVCATIDVRYQILVRNAKRLEAALAATQERRLKIDGRPQRKDAL